MLKQIDRKAILPDHWGIEHKYSNSDEHHVRWCETAVGSTTDDLWFPGDKSVERDFWVVFESTRETLFCGPKRDHIFHYHFNASPLTCARFLEAAKKKKKIWLGIVQAKLLSGLWKRFNPPQV